MDQKTVLVLDPVKKQLYTYNFDTHQISYKPDASKTHQEQIESELKSVSNLKGFDLTGWYFNSPECKKYQNRALWPHLTKSYTTNYPAFTTSRELSSAFSNVTDIKIRVNISEYIEKGRNNSSATSKRKQNTESSTSIILDIADQTLIFKACLVSTVNEAIKTMVRQAYKEHRIKIFPRDPDNILTFKVRGRREYFTGNFPLLAYRYVRTVLRGLEYLDVNLMEVPRNNMNLYKYYINPSEKFWDKKNFLVSNNFQDTQKDPKTCLMKPRIFKLNNLDPRKIRDEACQNLLKGKNVENLSFSGEIDWPFRARLCGVEALYKLFKEAFKGTATHNGTEEPEYLLRPKIKSTKEAHHGRRRTTGALEKRPKITGLNFLKKRKNTLKSQGDFNYSPYISHDPSCYISQELAIEYSLPAVPYLISFDMMLIYGDSIIENSFHRTEYCPFNYSSRLMEWVSFPLKIAELPKEARIGVNIHAIGAAGHSYLIGSCTRTLFDEFGELKTGIQEMQIWPFYRVEERLACMQDFWGMQTDHYEQLSKSKLEYSRIYIQFDLFHSESITWSLKDYSYLNSMYKSLAEPYRNTTITIKHKSSLGTYHISLIGSLGNDASAEEDKKLQEARPQIEQLAYLEKILMTDPLQDLDPEDKKLLFICRNHYKSLPLALPLFLKSVDWTHPVQVKEAYKVLSLWSSMKPEDALALLNADYPDENVRLYAVRRVSQLSDEDLAMYAPQLVQALSFECEHFSVLGEMLLERALRNPFQVGHAIFWGLRSQLHIKATAERFGLFLEQFIMLVGEYRIELENELKMVKTCVNIGNCLADKPKYEQRRDYLPTVIKQFAGHFNEACTLPINSTMEVKGFDANKCRIMKSKKMPLFMSMRNSETPSEFIQIIFKDGDDLRQDIITLQMIQVMDTIWLENGLDLRMKPYLVVATGDQSGMIEIVMNSKTTADIHNLYGKFGALKENTLKDYILEINSGDEETTEKAFDNFVRSCAGYCVATYVLGIGDRHNGNIMLTNKGHLFHIDFGHFLGNFKSKFGINRERSGFVLTQEMAYVMDGKDGYRFQFFKEYCCKAYNYVRKHGKRLINLFLLMISAGMPELKNKVDIGHLQKTLSLRMTEKEAGSKFLDEIENALNNYFRSIDNVIHVWR